MASKGEGVFVVTALSLGVLTATVVWGYIGFIGVLGEVPAVSLDSFPLLFTSSLNLVFCETEKSLEVLHPLGRSRKVVAADVFLPLALRGYSTGLL